MHSFFPRQTIHWSVEEPAALQRFTLSLPAMAITAGVLLRLYRWGLLSLGTAQSVWGIAGGVTGALIILLGFATAHLGNYTVRNWLWRAPLFAIVESAAEAAVSALLIGAGVEPLGSEHAHWRDWPGMVADIAALRAASVLTFAVLLGAVVHGVRFALLKREHRDSTALRIHEDHVRHAEELEAPTDQR